MITGVTPYEEILGRPPAEIEAKALADNFIPEFKLGEVVSNQQTKRAGEVDAIVLFAIQNGFAWGYRMKGDKDYFPSTLVKKVEK